MDAQTKEQAMKKSNYVTLFVCPDCDGDGEASGAPCDGFGVWICPTCKGEGLVAEKVLKRYEKDLDESDNP